jgi:hypothetical protein
MARVSSLFVSTEMRSERRRTIPNPTHPYQFGTSGIGNQSQRQRGRDKKFGRRPRSSLKTLIKAYLDRAGQLTDALLNKYHA